MSKKLVKKAIGLPTPASLSNRLGNRQKPQFAAGVARQESSLDCSRFAPLPEEFWKNAVGGKYYKPVKKSTTVRIDADVLAWLRAQGKGYQSRINAILRRQMLESLK